MHPSTKMNVSVRSRARAQSMNTHTTPAAAHRCGQGTFDRAERTPSRHPPAVERSPPRMPRKHSISRVPVEYRPYDRSTAPSPVRQRAQSESVPDDYIVLNASATPCSLSNASYEHEIAALEDQVLALEGELISAKMDIAVQEFNLLGLQNDNLQLQLAHSSAAAVASAELKALKEKYQEVLQTVQEQEKLIQQQAKDLDECKAWILGHVASTTHSRRIDSAISHELEALEGRGCVTQSVWSSRFQPGVLSGKLESIKQQQTAVAQVVALHVRVGQSVQAHALRVADAVKLEQALLEGVGDGPHPPTLVSVPASMANAPDPATIAHLPAPAGLAKHDGDNPAKEHHRTFDHVALEIGTLVGRYSPVQAS